MLISIVIPCYYSEKTIHKVVDMVTEEFKKNDGYECEFVLVNDGSLDEAHSLDCLNHIGRNILEAIVGVVHAAAGKHLLTHHSRACARAADQSAVIIELHKTLVEQRAPEGVGDAMLLAAAEEDASYTLHNLVHIRGIVAFRTGGGDASRLARSRLFDGLCKGFCDFHRSFAGGSDYKENGFRGVGILEIGFSDTVGAASSADDYQMALGSSRVSESGKKKDADCDCNQTEGLHI